MKRRGNSFKEFYRVKKRNMSSPGEENERLQPQKRFKAERGTEEADGDGGMLCSGKYHLSCFCVRKPQRTRQRQWPSARQHLKAQPHWELAGTLPIILPFRCGRGMGSTCYWNSAWKHKEVGMKAVCRLMALEFSATVTPGVWLTPEHSLPTAVFPSPTFLTSELLSCQSVTLSHVLESYTSLSKYLTNKMGLKLCWQREVISYSAVLCVLLEELNAAFVKSHEKLGSTMQQPEKEIQEDTFTLSPDYPDLTNHEFSFEVLTKERVLEQFSSAVYKVMINLL
ncbi:uncharacterized protein LOC132508419 [Lagenorhynchus albirostris]|uniref:uncharacterized protein LOC132508419 n=1 Tax=Lagenorhynchus albirostris TaxID=27610 RepID=UPI0028ED9FC1|nr:uncharacterized protein LOC132508419 [Lagenorhynchus albirostris]